MHENRGLIVSVGITGLGYYIKSDHKIVGNLIQGIGIGFGIGTLAHMFDKKFPNKLTEKLPHHDLSALISLPIIFTMDKTKVIKNKELTNNLYGIGIGVLSQHLITEGCSFCKSLYCENGDKLC